MAGQVCVDASLALLILLPHELTPRAVNLWRRWAEEDVEAVAPPLFFAEVTSVLRESVYFGRLQPDEGEEAFSAFSRLAVRSVSPAGLQTRAWELAKRHNRPRAYDAQYMAVAEMLGCDLWTADRRLVRSVKEPWARWAGEG